MAGAQQERGLVWGCPVDIVNCITRAQGWRDVSMCDIIENKVSAEKNVPGRREYEWSQGRVRGVLGHTLSFSVRS